jgi:TonB family protein
VAAVRVEQTSGVPSLDRSALRAVADATPLPPLPKNWGPPVLPATFVFRLHPE